jgi:hypothetical protein
MWTHGPPFDKHFTLRINSIESVLQPEAASGRQSLWTSLSR